jgi:hypothetical protein
MLSTCTVEWMCDVCSQFGGLHVETLRFRRLYHLSTSFSGSCKLSRSKVPSAQFEARMPALDVMGVASNVLNNEI